MDPRRPQLVLVKETSPQALTFPNIKTEYVTQTRPLVDGSMDIANILIALLMISVLCRLRTNIHEIIHQSREAAAAQHATMVGSPQAVMSGGGGVVSLAQAGDHHQPGSCQPCQPVYVIQATSPEGAPAQPVVYASPAMGQPVAQGAALTPMDLSKQ